MGTLRTLLALVVVFAHSYGVAFVGGRNAVQLFYLISGFLMSFVLVEARTYRSLHAFFLNRYLRLFPVYLAVAALTLAWLFLFDPGARFWEVYRRAPSSAIALLVGSNATLFGQDWVMFAGVRDGALRLVKNFNFSDPVLYPGLLVTQAWTLGVELTFYLCAPFLLRSTVLMAVLFVASLALRLVLIRLGFGADDPWTYRFFPTELAIFLLGAFAHQKLRPLVRRLPESALRRASSAATAAIAVAILVYARVPLDDGLKSVLLIASCAACLPLCFEFQRAHRLDSAIGNLSYPIYVGHVLLISMLQRAFPAVPLFENGMLALGFCVASIAFAWGLERTVAHPVEALRRRIRAAA